MESTPVKSLKTLLPSDFENTCNLPIDHTLPKKDSRHYLDNLPTPKKMDGGVPFKDRLLRKNEFRVIKHNRARLFDWYLEVCAAYSLDWQCFWMMVELVDSLIADFNYINLENIHLVGMVCCLIIAKLNGKKHFTNQYVVVGLGHWRFTQKQILREEENILKLIFEHSNFQRNNFYNILMQRYPHFPNQQLTQVMMWLVVVAMRPEVAVDKMGVESLRGMVDLFVARMAEGKKPHALQEIERDLREKENCTNLSKFGASIAF